MNSIKQLMNKPELKLFRLFSLVVLLIVLSAGRSFAQQDSTANVELSLDDGPHVLWENDSTAKVFYYCDDEVESREFIVKDTLRFNGFCKDSLSTYAILNKAHSVKPAVSTTDAKIFCISDIHGDYEHLTKILINAAVIDKNHDWIFGDAHFVITGDVFDRGAYVTECLWLIYKLEQQAASAGGMVHLLLGNHELMVLLSDLRYINEKYTDGISHRWRFRYDELYGANMELGRWLRSKNAVEIVNDILFVHGGISPDLIEKDLSLTNINDLARSGLAYTTTTLFFDDAVKFVYGSLGPFWYRGYHYEIENKYSMITIEQVDRLLEYFGVNHVVVGHTQQDSIAVYFDNKIIAIDIIVEDVGNQQALLWENGKVYRINGDGTKVKLW